MEIREAEAIIKQYGWAESFSEDVQEAKQTIFEAIRNGYRLISLDFNTDSAPRCFEKIQLLKNEPQMMCLED